METTNNLIIENNDIYIEKSKQIQKILSDTNSLSNNNLIQNIKNDINLENDDLMKYYKELVKEFNEYNEILMKDTNKIKNKIKNFEKIINKNINKKMKKEKNNNCGFAEKKKVPKSIQLFFNLDTNSKYPRTEIGGKFQNYIEQHNLKGNINNKNKNDKRIYKFDNNLSKLFKITEEHQNKINSCKSSNIKFPDGFNFYNYQTWIKKLYTDDEEN